jgi:hypothetical protein
MKTYTVHRHHAGSEAPDTGRSLPWQQSLARRVRRLLRGEPEEIVLVKEGICWPAAAFTVVWALWHRLWAFAICLLAVGTALGVVIASLEPDLARDAVLIISALVFVGNFANDARRRTLATRGYEFVGVVLGRSADGAQLRYLTDGGSAMAEARS